MKNVTLAIDDALLDQARGLAERRGTSLNAMIRSLLLHEVDREAQIALARAGMRELMENSTLEFEPGTNIKELSRRYVSDDELHGHEHPGAGGRVQTR
ncbi:MULTISPECIES: hypothetical protein [unclassified Aureimonas]|uniref:hypothetical protein n=1 Tax=unclassified Aureimonas TaxID=2615206 RepID=UPI0006F4B40A|nr:MULTISPECIES: hypothetical protein [unclassified Aureimonas]KQT52618.1 hypothetical protein ASG62_15570 [Aureimonas sp. Leaf427]KQT77483.1 hypothetical protein ASG54_10840 [Aureimonas sp. Leaf460]